MGVSLVGKAFQADKTGVADELPVRYPPQAQEGHLALYMAIGPPGQPDDPWDLDVTGAEPLSVGGDVDPSDSPMLIHQGLWFKILEASDITAGEVNFLPPGSPTSTNTVAAAAIYVFTGHDPDDPIPVSDGLPFCETGTNPCAGQNGNRTNPDCPCDVFGLDDQTVPANGMLAVFTAFSHKQAWPIAPPEGFSVEDFPLVERTGGGADIALLVAFRTVYEGTLDGPTAVPDDVGWDNAGARIVMIRPAVEPPGPDEPDRWFIGDPNEGSEPTTAAVELAVETGFGFGLIDYPGDGADVGIDDLTVHTITEQGWDEAEYGGRTRDTKRAALRCWIRETDFEQLRDAHRDLKRYMDDERVLVFIPPTLEPTYFDVFPAAVTPVIGGQTRSRNLALRQNMTEVVITFERQGKSRRPRVGSFAAESTQPGKISNQFNECWVTIDNPGKAESPLRWVFTPPSTGHKVVRIWGARISHGNIAERTKNERGFGTWDAERVDAVIGDDASIVSSAHASNGEEVTTTFDVPPMTWVDMTYFEATPLDPTSLFGKFRTFVVARQEEGQRVRYRRLWGTASGIAPTFADPPYREIDSTQMDQTKYRLVDLGEMSFDHYGNALVQQIQVRAVDADSDGLVVGIDSIKNLPADEQLVSVAERSFLSLDSSDVRYAADAEQVTHGVKPSDSSQGSLVLPDVDDTGLQIILGAGTIVSADKTDEGVSLMDPEGELLALGLWRLVVDIETYQDRKSVV